MADMSIAVCWDLTAVPSASGFFFFLLAEQCGRVRHPSVRSRWVTSGLSQPAAQQHGQMLPSPCSCTWGKPRGRRTEEVGELQILAAG